MALNHVPPSGGIWLLVDGEGYRVSENSRKLKRIFHSQNFYNVETMPYKRTFIVPKAVVNRLVEHNVAWRPLRELAGGRRKVSPSSQR